MSESVTDDMVTSLIHFLGEEYTEDVGNNRHIALESIQNMLEPSKEFGNPNINKKYIF